MPLDKNYLDALRPKPEIPRNRLLSGIFIGLGFAFTFYFLLFICRDILRVFYAYPEYRSFILPEHHFRLQNIFFAFIAVILGQSICIGFWFDRPRKIFTRRNYRKTMILHDQRALQWFSLSWAARMASVVLLTTFTCPWAMLVMGLYFLPPLIVLVLFLQSWTTIRQAFPRKSLKIMFSSAILLTGLSLGLSCFHLNEHTIVNKRILAKDITYKYAMEFPSSTNFERIERKSLTVTFHLVLDSGSPGNPQPKIIHQGEIVQLDEINGILKEKKKSMMGQLWPFVTVNLRTDKRLKTAFVRKVLTQLQQSGHLKVAYEVEPDPPLGTYCEQFAFNTKLAPPAHLIPPPEIPDSDSTLTISLDNNGPYHIAGTTYDRPALRKYLDEFAKKTGGMTRYEINEQANFGDYLFVRTSLRSSHYKHYQVMAWEKFNNDYDKLSIGKKKEIRSEHPLILQEKWLP